jgi:hypothetical protein
MAKVGNFKEFEPELRPGHEVVPNCPDESLARNL